MVARFKSECWRCEAPILRGASIVSFNGEWIHEACADSWQSPRAYALRSILADVVADRDYHCERSCARIVCKGETFGRMVRVLDDGNWDLPSTVARLSYRQMLAACERANIRLPVELVPFAG